MSIETTVFVIVLFLFHSLACHGYKNVTLRSTRYVLWTRISYVKFGQCHFLLYCLLKMCKTTGQFCLVTNESDMQNVTDHVLYCCVLL
jgi:hypothetical protein